MLFPLSWMLSRFHGYSAGIESGPQEPSMATVELQADAFMATVGYSVARCVLRKRALRKDSHSGPIAFNDLSTFWVEL